MLIGSALTSTLRRCAVLRHASAIWFTEPIASAKAMAAVTLLAAYVCSRSGRLLALAPGPVLAALA